jgi:hypothetical protein
MTTRRSHSVLQTSISNGNTRFVSGLKHHDNVPQTTEKPHEEIVFRTSASVLCLQNGQPCLLGPKMLLHLDSQSRLHSGNKHTNVRFSFDCKNVSLAGTAFSDEYAILRAFSDATALAMLFDAQMAQFVSGHSRLEGVQQNGQPVVVGPQTE